MLRSRRWGGGGGHDSGPVAAGTTGSGGANHQSSLGATEERFKPEYLEKAQMRTSALKQLGGLVGRMQA
jgi:hypothetical protein